MNALIESFYQSFVNLDAEGMAACYHKEIIFEDPAFGILKGEKAANMWRMLCESQKGKDFRVVFSNIEADERNGNAHWEAFYTFSKTGRKVHNIIKAEFEFRDGKIIKHIDSFDLYQWSKQALGVSGFLIGWSAYFKGKLQAQTKKLLAKFEERLQ